MKRRDFLRRFGIGVGAVVAAPAIAKTLIEEKPWMDQEAFNAEMDMMHGSRINLAGRNPSFKLEVYRLVTINTSTPLKGAAGTAGITTYDDVVRFNDKIVIPPEYTNKDIFTSWLVTGPDALFTPTYGKKEYSFTIIPYNMTVELTEDIPKGTTLYISCAESGETKDHTLT